MTRKRTLWVRTVLNVSGLQRPVRRLAPLLVLLFLMPSFSGCIGGPSVTWGSSDGEYSASLGSENTGVQTVSVTNKLATNSQIHIEDETYNLASCNGSVYTLSGWLVQTKIFNPPQIETKAVTSWMVKEMSYGAAQDMEPGSVYVSIVNNEKDWEGPVSARAQESGTTNDRKEFPHRDWALVGLIPANENVFDAAIQMNTNQAVKMEGYLLETKYINEETQLNGCDIDASSSNGWYSHFIVTSMTYGNERVASADEAYVAGDIPFIGRGLYTTLLLISIVASGALYIFSRNQIILNADTQAQAMLSEQQMRAGKGARHEAARHDARMAATTKVKEAEYTGKPTKKSATAPTFDIGAALAEDAPGESTGHYVAGSSVTSTEEAEAMQDMITEMQEEQAFEQELQEKGLRNIIGSMPKGGGAGKRRSIATKPHTSRLESDTPEPEPEPEPEPKRKPTRRTRKTRSAEPEPEPVEEEVEEEAPTRRKVDPEVNDEGDFSDFSV